MHEKGKTRQVEIPDVVRKLMDEHPELKFFTSFLLGKIGELEARIAELEKEYKERIEELERENRDFKRRLVLYENAHVPPS